MSDAVPLPARFFHGSAIPFEAGAVLAPRGDAYAEGWGGTDFYAALERWRPAGLRAHRDAVFLVGEVDDVELAGGSTEWCVEAEPAGPVTRHDLNWGSEVAMLVQSGLAAESREVRSAAESYWAGLPHPDESVWEYLASAATVVGCAPYDGFDADGVPGPTR